MTAPESPVVMVATDGPVGILQISRPATKNSLNREVWRRIPAACDELDTNPDVRVILVRGDGGNFSSGADVSEFAAKRATEENARVYDEMVVKGVLSVLCVKKPTIACIDGSCLGAGMALAAACDLRYADDNAYFGIPAGQLGLAYPVELTRIVEARLGSTRSAELLLLAQRFSAPVLLSYGFLNGVTPAGALQGHVLEIAKKVCDLAPLTQTVSKLSLLSLVKRTDSSVAKHAIDFAARTTQSLDYREGLSAFREKRKPEFKGK